MLQAFIITLREGVEAYVDRRDRLCVPEQSWTLELEADGLLVAGIGCGSSPVSVWRTS